MTKTEALNQLLAPRGIVMRSEYTRAKDKADFQCSLGHNWRAAVSSVKSGHGCPHCVHLELAKARTIPLSEVQAELMPRGIRIIEGYKNNNSRALFQCDKGHEWRAVVKSVKCRGNGCPTCGNAQRGKSNALTFEEISERLAPRGIVLKSEYKNGKTKGLFSADCGHEWRAQVGSVLQGTGCAVCAGKRITADQINALLAPRGIRMIGEYCGGRSATAFQCEKGHKWSAAPGHVARGTGCPQCATTGHWSKEHVYLYVMAYSEKLTKIGISTQPKKRLMELKKPPYQIELIALFLLEDTTGAAAYAAEKSAHAHFAPSHAGLKGFDGATELFNITPAQACIYLAKIGACAVEIL